jgi:hypothetical protein
MLEKQVRDARAGIEDVVERTWQEREGLTTPSESLCKR